MSRATESVYPLNTANADNGGAFVPQMGLTIREHFAAMAMQGLFAGTVYRDSAEQCAAFAVEIADALIAELAK